MQGERAVRDRRVMFLLNPPAHESDRPTLTGTLDVRDARHMVLTIRRPDGREVVHGISGDTAWMSKAKGLALKARTEAELVKIEKDLAGLEGRLSDPNFAVRAPEAVVAKARAQHDGDVHVQRLLHWRHAGRRAG